MPSSRPPDWLHQPFAHRGLHDSNRGIVENTASAVAAAVQLEVGIEVDLMLAACGTVMVFHDATLDRLTIETGKFAERTRSELQAIALKGTTDGILSFDELLELVKGQVPLLLEMKTDWTGRTDLVDAILERIETYQGRFALMSFDPRLVRHVRTKAPHLIRGLISYRYDDEKARNHMSLATRSSLRWLLSTPRIRPDFIAYDINALPSIAAWIAHNLFRLPLLTWTVRTKAQQDLAEKYADAIIFENFVPEPKYPK